MMIFIRLLGFFLYFHFPRSGNEAKSGVEFRHSTRNTVMGMQFLNTRFIKTNFFYFEKLFFLSSRNAVFRICSHCGRKQKRKVLKYFLLHFPFRFRGITYVSKDNVCDKAQRLVPLLNT